MAATRLIPMHQQKGKSVTRSLQDRTDYAKDDLKTDDGRYVSAYECDPATVDLDFAATKRDYELSTGRNMHDGGVIAYQIRQSIKPGEGTPEEANQIGYETAMRWTKGKHAFIVAIKHISITILCIIPQHWTQGINTGTFSFRPLP